MDVVDWDCIVFWVQRICGLIFDVGCGLGYWMVFLVDWGYEVEGVDLVLEFVEVVI